MKQFIICPKCGMPAIASVKTISGIAAPFNKSFTFECVYCFLNGFETDTQPMKAFSVRQPWAYLICAGIKPIENRTWKLPEKHKGERVLIHASAKRYDINKIFTNNQWKMMGEKNRVECVVSDSPTSAIIGSVEIVNCVKNHPSIWVEPDCWNWVLADPVLFEKPILNVKGRLSFFVPEIPDDI
jgi:hypothetical protein